MKQIEKITKDGDVMYFKKYSRKDLKAVIDDFFENAMMEIRMYGVAALNQRNEIPVDEDSIIVWTLDDGTFGHLDSSTPWSEIKKPPISRIKNMKIMSGGYCLGFFGKDMKLEYNEDYGYWWVNGDWYKI